MLEPNFDISHFHIIAGNLTKNGVSIIAKFIVTYITPGSLTSVFIFSRSLFSKTQCAPGKETR